jgi:hypothetical protein
MTWASIEFYLFVVEWIYTFGQAEIEEEVSSVVVVAAAAFQFFRERGRPEMGGKVSNQTSTRAANPSN